MRFAVVPILFGVLVGQMIGVTIADVMPAQPLTFPPRSGTHLVIPAEVIDGDTVRFWWCVEDVGRLDGLNAPELHGDDAARGRTAKSYLQGLLPQVPTTMRVAGREKYGRSLVEFFDRNGRSLNRAMIQAGHAKAWDGRGQRP